MAYIYILFNRKMIAIAVERILSFVSQVFLKWLKHETHFNNQAAKSSIGMRNTLYFGGAIDLKLELKCNKNNIAENN